jgi:hypothetical protein
VCVCVSVSGLACQMGQSEHSIQEPGRQDATLVPFDVQRHVMAVMTFR